MAPKLGRNRQRFDLTLTTNDLTAEVDRVVGAGATRLGSAGDGAVDLADPDGNEFSITHG